MLCVYREDVSLTCAKPLSIKHADAASQTDPCTVCDASIQTDSPSQCEYPRHQPSLLHRLYFPAALSYIENEDNSSSSYCPSEQSSDNSSSDISEANSGYPTQRCCELCASLHWMNCIANQEQNSFRYTQISDVVPTLFFRNCENHAQKY